MSCGYEKYINNMLYGKLNKGQEMELMQHAKGCAECSMKLKGIENIDNKIKEAVTYSNYKDFRYKTLKAVEEKKGFTRSRVFLHKARVYVYALAAILLIAVSIYSFNLLLNPRKPAGTNTQDTPTPSPSPSVNETNTGKQQTADENKDINDLVTIKEAVNKEGISPNGDKVRYIYEVPIINIDKPGAKKINEMFSNLEKDMENRIGNGQNMTLTIPAKAFLNDGIISIVMQIVKGAPGGIHVANYDIKNDKEISTKDLLDKYKFDPQKLISEINMSKSTSIDYFIYTITDYSPSDNLKNPEEIIKKTKGEKEKYVIDNIDKITVYINNDGKFVFVHRAEMEDEELAVASSTTPKSQSGLGNIKDIKGFTPFENQSFMVNLNSWGNVKFVSGKLTGGNHIPVEFYLTNKDGDILYDFTNEAAGLPYSVDVKAVSFQDVNKDGLKDVIIIVGDNGLQVANVYLQKADGSFTNDYKLNQGINESGNNKDIKTVTDYLSKKF